MAGPSILVSFLADNKELKKAIDGVDKDTQGFKANLAKVGAAIGAAFAATKVVEFAKDSINAAKDLNANLSRTKSIFGEAGAAVEDWSKKAASSLRISQADALGMANAVGKTLVGALGFSADAAAGMSTDIVKLAKDMATFNRIPVEEALDGITKGMTGATRGLKSMGVVISDADIKNKALALGLYDGKGALDASAKAQATYALILEQTTIQQGATERASKSLGAQQERISAEWKNAQATLGQALLPVITELATVFANHVVPAIQIAATIFRDYSGIIIPLAGAIVAIMVAFKAAAAAQALWTAAVTLWKVAVAVATAAQWLWNAALTANPIGLVVIAIAALVVAIVAAYAKVDWFRAGVDAMGRGAVAAFGWVLDAAKAVFGWVQSSWPLLLAILTGPFGLAVLMITRHFDDIVGFVKGMPGRIATAASGMWDGIWQAFRAAINFIVDGWNGLKFSLPEIDTKIPGIGKVGGGSFGVPPIPRLAQGGIVQSPTLALLGESGPEAVVPLGAAGPALVIHNATFVEPVDVDLLIRKLEFAVAAGAGR